MNREDPRLAVAERPPGEPRHQAREDGVAHATDEGHLVLDSTESVAVDDVGFVSEDGLDEPRDVVGVVLAVRVELDRDVGAGDTGRVEPAPHRGTQAPVDLVGHQPIDPGLLGVLRGAIARPVVDHEGAEPHVRKAGRELSQHLDRSRDGLLFVVGRHDDHDERELGRRACGRLERYRKGTGFRQTWGFGHRGGSTRCTAGGWRALRLANRWSRPVGLSRLSHTGRVRAP